MEIWLFIILPLIIMDWILDGLPVIFRNLIVDVIAKVGERKITIAMPLSDLLKRWYRSTEMVGKTKHQG